MKKLSLALVFIMLLSFVAVPSSFAWDGEGTKTFTVADKTYYSYGENGLTETSAYLVANHYISYDVTLTEGASYKVTAMIQNSSDANASTVKLVRKNVKADMESTDVGNVKYGEAYIPAGSVWREVDFGEISFDAGTTRISVVCPSSGVPVYFKSLTFEKVGDHGDAPIMYCVNDRSASSASANYNLGNLGIWGVDTQCVRLDWNGYVTFDSVKIEEPGVYKLTQFCDPLTTQNYMYVYVNDVLKIQKTSVVPSNANAGEMNPYELGTLTFEEAGTYTLKFYNNIGTGMLFSRFILEKERPLEAGISVKTDSGATLSENGTGSGYTTFSSGSISEHNVFVEKGGKYTFSINRAMGGNASLNVYVDDELKLNVTVPKTDTWSPGVDFTMGDIVLSEGAHTLKFETPSALMNVWNFKLAPVASAVEIDAVKEDNTQSAGGKTYARLSSGKTLSYTVNAEKEGYYGITFVGAATAADKKVTISANDGAFEEKVMINGTAFGEFAEFSGGYVYLNEGENTISFTNNWGSAIDIIKITMEEASLAVYNNGETIDAESISEGELKVEFIPAGMFEGEKMLVALAIYESDNGVKTLKYIATAYETAEGVNPISATVSDVTFEDGKTYEAKAFALNNLYGITREYTVAQ